MVLTVGKRQYDAVQNYINARYICDHESMWRLLESPMHDRSHAAIRLPV